MWPVSTRFRQELMSPVHTIRVRMQVLDTDFKVIQEFSDTGDTLSPAAYIVDGTVDLDIERGIRRTFTVNLLNENGEFSPGSAWAGTFFVNRLVRLYRGISYGDSEELVPIGTFMVDHADTVIERNISLVVLSGSDLWKKLGKSMFAKPRTWEAGTLLTEVVRSIATGAGIASFIDDLSDDRTDDSRKLNRKFVVEQGDIRGDELMRLAAAYGLDIYFDPLGRLVISDFRSPEDSQTVWTFNPDLNNMLLSARVTYKDDSLYNAVLVVGTGGASPVTFRKRDTDPTSVTNIYRLGERTLKYETDSITTLEAAERAAERLFYRNVLVTEDISIDVMCNPALDGNDVIALREDTFSKVNSTYRVRSVSIPLASSRQTIRLLRNINLG